MPRFLLIFAALVVAVACSDSGSRSFSRDTAFDGSADTTADTSDATEGGHPLCSQVLGLCDPLPAGAPIGEPTVVAPSGDLPPEFVSQTAHNNLAVVWHEGRVFLAIRTAPSHFAAPETVMYIVSSSDLHAWRYEGEVAIGTDVREPQLVSWQGRLWLYYAILGDNPFEFEPQGVERIEYEGPDRWSEPSAIEPAGLIPWRIKPIGDRLHLIGYVGGENVYDSDGEGIETTWLVSDDGETWAPFLPTGPVVRIGGASETDLVFRDDGSLVAVARNEAGDATGFGSNVCRAPADALGEWQCASDPRKYDSPLMLIHAGQPWLIARRNVTDDGHYDLGLDDLSMSDRFMRYQLDYWTRPKRCALWRVNGDALEVRFEADLPSRGDTCFPDAIDLGGGRHLVFNYTSPLDGDDLSWQVAQGGTTWVYYLVVDLGAVQ